MVASLSYPPISLLSPASIDSRGKEKKHTHTHTPERKEKNQAEPGTKKLPALCRISLPCWYILAGAKEDPDGPERGGQRDPLQTPLRSEGQGCAPNPGGPRGCSSWPRPTWAGMQSATRGALGTVGATRTAWPVGRVAHGDDGDDGTAGPAAPRLTGVPVREGEPWRGQGAVSSPGQGWGAPGWMGSPWHGEPG